MKQIWFIACIITCIIIQGCVTPAPVPQPPTTPKGWAYDDAVKTDVAPLAKLAINPGDLCPNYLGSGAMKFWSALVKCTAKAESGFDPNDSYTENFIDAATGVKAISVGLLQLSVGDKLNYKTPNCQLLTPENLKAPLINLACGTEIMGALIARKGGDVRKSLGAYWSTIRDRTIDACMKTELPECFK